MRVNSLRFVFDAPSGDIGEFQFALMRVNSLRGSDSRNGAHRSRQFQFALMRVNSLRDPFLG